VVAVDAGPLDECTRCGHRALKSLLERIDKLAAKDKRVGMNAFLEAGALGGFLASVPDHLGVDRRIKGAAQTGTAPPIVVFGGKGTGPPGMPAEITGWNRRYNANEIAPIPHNTTPNFTQPPR
jgi:hypothetical protein